MSDTNPLSLSSGLFSTALSTSNSSYCSLILAIPSLQFYTLIDHRRCVGIGSLKYDCAGTGRQTTVEKENSFYFKFHCSPSSELTEMKQCKAMWVVWKSFISCSPCLSAGSAGSSWGHNIWAESGLSLPWASAWNSLWSPADPWELFDLPACAFQLVLTRLAAAGRTDMRISVGPL